MNKSVLVIDTPKKCSECVFAVNDLDCFLAETIRCKKRPKKCPLKDLRFVEDVMYDDEHKTVYRLVVHK